MGKLGKLDVATFVVTALLVSFWVWMIWSAAVEEQDWLRVVVCEQPRTGLGDEIRALLPGALEVRVDPEFLTTRRTPDERRAGRSPVQLFEEYLATRNRGDVARLTTRFAELLDEIQSVPAAEEE